jgi:hypothetical protein
MGESGGPLTWRPVLDHPDKPKSFKDDLVYATCRNGHECRLVRTVHAIAADGRMSPSYVCPIKGCSFHEFVCLDGWSKDLTARSP